jgi:hypothetical protein
MHKRVCAAAAVVAVALAACGGSSGRAQPPGTTRHRLQTVTNVAGLERPVTVRTTLMFPTGWTVVRSSRGHVRFREGTTACTYTVDASVAVVQIDAPTAVAAARSLVPTADGRLLEAGHRGSATWRVVKLHGNGTQVRLEAVRAQPLRFLSTRAGRPTWRVTRVRGVSDRGDECHAGTYRDTLGPTIGDALATVR